VKVRWDHHIIWEQKKVGSSADFLRDGQQKQTKTVDNMVNILLIMVNINGYYIWLMMVNNNLVGG
jgi:hypothetical protein